MVDLKDVTLGRRRLLAGAASLAALRAGSCETQGPGGTAPTSGAGTQGLVYELPTFTPYEGVTPDLPALPNGTSAFHERLPADPQPFLTETPGKGGAVNVFSIVNSPVVPLDRNPRWADLNEMLGADISLTGAPIGDYPSKFQTLVAGNDLPDICAVLPTITTRIPEMLRATFTDLSEYLSGDAVNDYPALANIPTYNWQNGIYGDSIYLIPSPRWILYRAYVVRADIAEAAGVDPHFSNGTELGELLAGLSNSKTNTFATASALALLDMVNEMMGTPNNWVEEDGRFTKDYEAESFAEALDVVRGFWDKQYIHPDSFTPNLSTNLTAMYAGGQAPLLGASATWANLAAEATKQTSAARSEAIVLPQWDGSDAPVLRWQNAGTPYLAGIPKAEPERVQELLAIINALAAPFGTAEFMTIKYGTEGRDWSRNDDGTIAQTEDGAANRVAPLIYAGSPPQVHNHLDAEAARAEYHQEAADMEHTAVQAQAGLESATDQSTGGELRTQIDDVIAGIIQGRLTMDDWAPAVQEWRDRGGDTIRDEYESSFATVNG